MIIDDTGGANFRSRKMEGEAISYVATLRRALLFDTIWTSRAIQKLQRRCLVVERRRESPRAAQEDLEQELEKPLFCSENLCEKETPLQ